MFTCHLTPAAIGTATPLQPHRAITACFLISFVTVVHYQRARLLFNKALKALLHLQWSQFPFAVLQHVYIKGLCGKSTGSPLCPSSQSQQAGSDALLPKALQRVGLLTKNVHIPHIFSEIHLSIWLCSYWELGWQFPYRFSCSFDWVSHCSLFPKLCLTIVLPFSGIPAALSAPLLKGHASSGDALWNEKELDCSGWLEENYFHVHRGYCLPGKGIWKGTSAEILKACSTQRETVWEEEEGSLQRWIWGGWFK